MERAERQQGFYIALDLAFSEFSCFAKGSGFQYRRQTAPLIDPPQSCLYRSQLFITHCAPDHPRFMMVVAQSIE